MAAAAAAKVVHRCDTAKETGQLDLSECELRQVPSCLYLLMKETTVKHCDFSQNMIKKLPTKFGQEFTRITGLNLHHNQLSTLPDTLSCCCHLEHLDLSRNNLEFVPDVIYSFQHLQTLNLSNNRITDFEMDKLKDLPTLKEIDLSNNIFNEELKGKLQTINHLGVKL